MHVGRCQGPHSLSGKAGGALGWPDEGVQCALSVHGGRGGVGLGCWYYDAYRTRSTGWHRCALFMPHGGRIHSQAALGVGEAMITVGESHPGRGGRIEIIITMPGPWSPGACDTTRTARLVRMARGLPVHAAWWGDPLTGRLGVGEAMITVGEDHLGRVGRIEITTTQSQMPGPRGATCTRTACVVSSKDGTGALRSSPTRCGICNEITHGVCGAMNTVAGSRLGRGGRIEITTIMPSPPGGGTRSKDGTGALRSSP